MFVAMMLVAMMLIALPLAAQQPATPPRGGTITGVVRDSLARPVAGADVVAIPGESHARTDSTGRFVLTGLDNGAYTVRARKLGYAPAEWSVDLSKSGRLDIGLVLSQRMAALDTVRVRADGTCSPHSLDGFFCRRKLSKGLFLDYTDIDDKRTTYTADLFRDIDGFRVDVRPTSRGPIRVPVALEGWRCLNTLVDGWPVTGANQIPELSWDVVAMEVYKLPADVPREYEKYAWTSPFARQAARCSLVVYWTQFAKLSP